MTLSISSMIIAGLVLSGCIGLMVSVYLQHRRTQVLEMLLNQQAKRLNAMDSDFGALLSCARRIGDRIGDAERNEKSLQKQLDQLALSRDEGQLAVDHAIKLLNAGQSFDEVQRVCELSQGEVEILQNLSRYRGAA